MGGVLKVECFSLLFCLGGVCPVFYVACFIFFVSLFDTPPGESIRFTLKGMLVPSGMRRERYFTPKRGRVSFNDYIPIPTKYRLRRNKCNHNV